MVEDLLSVFGVTAECGAALAELRTLQFGNWNTARFSGNLYSSGPTNAAQDEG